MPAQRGLGATWSRGRPHVECPPCSDGLSDIVPDDQMTGVLSRLPDPQPVCEALIQHALANGGKDNVTLVIASIDEEDAQ